MIIYFKLISVVPALMCMKRIQRKTPTSIDEENSLSLIELGKRQHQEEMGTALMGKKLIQDKCTLSALPFDQMLM